MKVKGNRKGADEAVAERFEYDIDDEFEELDNTEAIDGEDSDDELARRLVRAIPSL